MTFKTKFATGLATASLLVTLMAPAAFATTNITVGGNAKYSTNKVTVKNKNLTVLGQGNLTSFTNSVNSSANTGKNKANGNLGGVSADPTVTSGNAKSKVTIVNTGSTNEAVAPECGCNNTGDTTVDVSGNGKYSKNTVDVNNTNATLVFQLNATQVTNAVNSSADTGGNTANDNGGGNVSVTSGNATSNVSIENGGSSNTL